MSTDWLTADETFIVHWTDYVANEWTMAVRGPFERTERRLADLVKRGQDHFGMTYFTLGNSTDPDFTVSPIKTADDFFALDWD